jgi:D-cysteine desulfhydrase
MHLSRFARRRYTQGWTPLEKLDRLSTLLGGPDLYIKRDDLLGLAGGGNKTRKLEFLVADALAKGADTLVTCGAVQSNHCRLTLAAAAKEGLKCRLVLEERVANSYNPDSSGNNFLFRLLGVEAVTVVKAGVDLAAEMQKVAGQVAALGRKAYIIPGGGSNPLGALGYVSCAEEILAQTFEMGIRLDHIVCASGSTGTHAGLICGLIGNNSHIPLTGINVRRTREEQEPNVHKLAQELASLLDI